MTIKAIKTELCRDCPVRVDGSCPPMESCATDVIRMGDSGLPRIAYPGDCHSCFFCQIDCPKGAINVTAAIPLPLLR